MTILEQMTERAKKNPQRIVLPEGDEPRTLEAANIILRDGLAQLILIGPKDKILSMAAEKGYEYISRATIFDPATDAKVQAYANLLYELRKAKGMTEEEALKKAHDPLYLGCLMIKNGDADGELAGARGTTADTIRPAFQILKTKPGCSIVSGAFLMFTKATHLIPALCRLRRQPQSGCTTVGRDSRLHSRDSSQHCRYRTARSYAVVLY